MADINDTPEKIYEDLYKKIFEIVRAQLSPVLLGSWNRQPEIKLESYEKIRKLVWATEFKLQDQGIVFGMPETKKDQ